MPLRLYNALVRDINKNTTEIARIGVLRGASQPLLMAYQSSAAYRFANASDGETISNGLFNRNMTFFVQESSYSSNLLDGTLFPFYATSNLAVNFPGGCAVTVSRYSTGGDPYARVSYTHRGRSITLNCWSRYVVGLMSDDVYTFQTTASNGTIIQNESLMYPLIYPLRNTVNSKVVYSASLYPLPENPPSTATYPAAFYTINSNSTEANVNTFSVYKEFLTDFWSTIDAFNGYTYFCILEYSPGGDVNPKEFWATANEPRMFTVTPDEHHAIHSVTAYNTLTNQQIPLQESGLDLLTGTKSYMFTMPAANARIIVEFRSIEITIPVIVKYTSPRGKVFTTSFNLLYDDTEQREKTAPPVEEQEGENQNE